ncbi:hypothetical protein BCR33DRAFT_362736 [Rhizoclosmatium globosum]|uniref:L domain-like protein n=1 Tax=Rhizoclosmatium globosum TaxID=329046 RepID=A0A1Y2C217_9FUNG|nr:hypothetical protein BCR33DRAFT_362736 [Rhizoclosmatium globosum]|eukprot:ORY40355.1 hypothetical protein BCR33DRAFT_362736 [Rhizoclosmatium globosum]
MQLLLPLLTSIATLAAAQNTQCLYLVKAFGGIVDLGQGNCVTPVNNTYVTYANWVAPAGTPGAVNAAPIIALRLSGVGLTSVPKDLNKLTALQILDLSNNKIVGQLPDTLSKITSLQSINLNGDNLFTASKKLQTWLMTGVPYALSAFVLLKFETDLVVKYRDVGGSCLPAAIPRSTACSPDLAYLTCLETANQGQMFTDPSFNNAWKLYNSGGAYDALSCSPKLGIHLLRTTSIKCFDTM